MNVFTSIKDVKEPEALVALALKVKNNPGVFGSYGKLKTLGLVFFNPSLRTRLSTQKAALNLGMQVVILNINSDSWILEMEDGAIMNGNAQEHIREAAAVLSQYCDIIGVRTFAQFNSRAEDYGEFILQKFIRFSSVPILSLESATLHPLQSLADWMTITEQQRTERPKVVLSWAPHPKILPQAVANSFVEWMRIAHVDLTVTFPKEIDLAPSYLKGISVTHNQEKAMENADFVYAKNWSSFSNYGKGTSSFQDWKIDERKMALTHNAYFMHCLPVRRNVVVSDGVLDSDHSLVLEQANNRTYAAQAVLLKMLGYEG